MKTVKQLDKITLTGLVIVSTFILPIVVVLIVKLTTNPTLHF